MVTVVATGDGWHLEEQVAIPPSGDPRADLSQPALPERTRGRARAPAARRSRAPTPILDQRRRRAGQRLRRPAARSLVRRIARPLRHRRAEPGAAFSITASAIDCRADPINVTVVAGDNHVRSPVPAPAPHRRRDPPPRGEQLDGHVVALRGRAIRIRCTGRGCSDSPATPTSAALEYQIGDAGDLAQRPDRVGGRARRSSTSGRCDGLAGIAPSRESFGCSRRSSRRFSRSRFSMRFSCAATMRSSAWIAASATPCASTEL